jgi:hypothetical protein
MAGQVVVEHPLLLFSFFSAFAGAIDEIATARPATKSDAAFMAIFSQIPGQQNAIPARMIVRLGPNKLKLNK